ncbi:MAG: hypothetical protein KAR42_15045 [candidate division Zixibacteria bacterium]|nr:hypothetical protein [candidate division Zixibacteria bacterium]
MVIGNNEPGFFRQNIPAISTPVFLPFIIPTGGNTTLASDVTLFDKTISLTSATGFGPGSFAGVFSGVSGEGRFYFGTQIGVSVGNDITLDTPLDFAFSATDPVVAFSKEMLVDGSTTPQTFQVRAGGVGSSTYLLINRIIIAMTTFSAPTLSDFGDGSALVEGLVFRVNNGIVRNLNNIKSNQAFVNWGFDFNFYSVLGGTDGLGGRVTWAGEDKHGTPLLLAPSDALECIVQENITGNALSLSIIAEGREVPQSYLRFFGVT